MLLVGTMRPTTAGTRSEFFSFFAGGFSFSSPAPPPSLITTIGVSNPFVGDEDGGEVR